MYMTNAKSAMMSFILKVSINLQNPSSYKLHDFSKYQKRLQSVLFG